MDTSITYLDEMILRGYRGGPPKATCRLAPGVSNATRAHERNWADHHKDLKGVVWTRHVMIRISTAYEQPWGMKTGAIY